MRLLSRRRGGFVRCHSYPSALSWARGLPMQTRPLDPFSHHLISGSMSGIVGEFVRLVPQPEVCTPLGRRLCHDVQTTRQESGQGQDQGERVQSTQRIMRVVPRTAWKVTVCNTCTQREMDASGEHHNGCNQTANLVQDVAATVQ